jgi:hypothetical protein
VPRIKTAIDWSAIDHRLGTISDRALAIDVGCSEMSILRRRRQLDIEPFAPKAPRR